jgi:hypothetical protein
MDRESLRRYIAANVVGDNPPPLTAEARDLVYRVLGSDPGQSEQTQVAA